MGEVSKSTIIQVPIEALKRGAGIRITEDQASRLPQAIIRRDDKGIYTYPGVIEQISPNLGSGDRQKLHQKRKLGKRRVREVTTHTPSSESTSATEAATSILGIVEHPNPQIAIKPWTARRPLSNKS
jgi:hypothetical protein